MEDETLIHQSHAVHGTDSATPSRVRAKNEEVDLSAHQKKALKQIAQAIYEEVKKDPSLR